MVRFFGVAGPEIVESRTYYRLIADILGVGLAIMELPVDACLREQPEAAPFLCHRVYDLHKLYESGVTTPQTPLEHGLRSHIASLIDQA
jgi:hypothetical protein